MNNVTVQSTPDILILYFLISEPYLFLHIIILYSCYTDDWLDYSIIIAFNNRLLLDMLTYPYYLLTLPSQPEDLEGDYSVELSRKVYGLG